MKLMVALCVVAVLGFTPVSAVAQVTLTDSPFVLCSLD